MKNNKIILLTFLTILIGLVSLYSYAQITSSLTDDKINQIEKEIGEIKAHIDTNFWQNIFSTFIGAILGFILSIVFFHLTLKLNKANQRKSTEKNLIKEFEFNEHYLKETILVNLAKVIEKVSVNNHAVFEFFSYVNYQRIFVQRYFQEGFLYEKLNPDDIYLLETILGHMDIGIQNYINGLIEQWKHQTIDQQKMQSAITFERDNITQYIKELARIKQKIIGKGN